MFEKREERTNEKLFIFINITLFIDRNYVHISNKLFVPSMNQKERIVDKNKIIERPPPLLRCPILFKDRYSVLVFHVCKYPSRLFRSLSANYYDSFLKSVSCSYTSNVFVPFSRLVIDRIHLFFFLCVKQRKKRKKNKKIDVQV